MNINEIIVTEDIRLLEAMKILDQTSKKILFVTKEDKLIATLTDGDVRRWILKHGVTDAEIGLISNYNPKYLYFNESFHSQSFLQEHKIEAVPIVDTDLKILAIHFSDNEELKNSPPLDIPVVIMAGGKGTRLYPYTNILPKPLIPIAGVPIIERIIRFFKHQGTSKTFVIVNHKKNMIKSYFREIDTNYDIDFIDEDIPLGTGGGLALLKGKINTTSIVSNSDIIIREDFSKILKEHQEQKNLITMICAIKNIQIPYGVVAHNEFGQIINITEKPINSYLINTGTYIIEPEVIEGLEDKTFINFTDIAQKAIENLQKVGIFPISEDSWDDMGQMEEYQKMNEKYEHNGLK